MNFTEIISQAALFTAVFFIFNKIFNRFIFKNRQDIPLSFNKLFMMFVMYLGVSASIQYFLPGNNGVQNTTQPTKLQSGQLVSVATQPLPESEPLNTTLHMPAIDKISTVSVQNEMVNYDFAEELATVQSATGVWNGKTVPLIAQSEQNFIITIADFVPDHFKLVSDQQTGQATRELIFKAPYKIGQNSGTIQKKFIIHQTTYQIDLELKITNLPENQTVRLFVPSCAHDKQLHAIVNKKNSLKIQLDQIALNKPSNFTQFAYEPTIYGFSSVYFSNVCFAYSASALSRAYLRSLDAKQYQAILQSCKLSGDVQLSWSFYCGPNCPESIQKVCPALSGLVDYGFFGFIARPLAKLLDLVTEYTGNYGWAILLIALLVKILTIPLALRSERGLKEQAEFEKKRLHLQQKFKHDKAALDQATAELISKHGFPMFMGCLPMLINIPMFWALNQVLSRCTKLYGVSFLWLPDLAQADPYYILPVLTFIGMSFAPNPQAGTRQMFSKMGFGLLLAAFTSYLASGLALFIVVNTLFGLVQNSLVKYARVIIKF